MTLRNRSLIPLAIIGLLSMFAIACGGSAEEAADSSSAPTTVPTRVVIAVTQASIAPTPTVGAVVRVEGEPALLVLRYTDRSIEVPEIVPAGLTTIRLQNDGSSPHSISVLRVRDRHTPAELKIGSLNRNFPTAWAPPLATIWAVQPGESTEFTVRLVPGTHAATDWSSDASGIPWTAFGLYAGFEVVEETSVAIEWPTDVIEIGVEDFKFTGLTDLKAGEHKFMFKNTSTDQLHELVFVPLDDGLTAQDLFGEFRYRVRDERIDSAMEGAFGIGYIGWGETVVHSLNIPAGEYAVVDLAPSEFSFGAPPHVSMGMLEQITVRE